MEKSSLFVLNLILQDKPCGWVEAHCSLPSRIRGGRAVSLLCQKSDGEGRIIASLGRVQKAMVPWKQPSLFDHCLTNLSVNQGIHHSGY